MQPSVYLYSWRW